jgi:hypothetical protein
LIAEYGCGSCHTIPGVPGADATAAPPLERFYERTYIAGKLANTKENLALWIRDPQEIEPGTAMPDLGVGTDGMIYALSVQDGSVVWQWQAPGGTNAWPAVAGDTIVWPFGLGDSPSLIALSLGGSGTIPTPPTQRTPVQTPEGR